MRAKLQKSYEKCKINDNFISFQGVTVRLIKPKKEYKFHKNIKILGIKSKNLMFFKESNPKILSFYLDMLDVLVNFAAK